MASEAPDNATLPAVRPRPDVQNLQPMLDRDRFEHFQRASTALMRSTLLPEAVRGGSPEACFSNLMLIFDLSDRWKLPALSIAQCVAIVHGKVVYEGKLIAAMLDASLGIRLQYHWTGERGTPGYRVFVTDRPWAEVTPEDWPKALRAAAEEDPLAPLKAGVYPTGWRVIDGSVGEWQTFQKDSRTPNPAWTGAASRNQLAYRGSREWVRLYEPAQLLGVYGDDEADAWRDQWERGGRLEAHAVPVEDRPTGITAGFTRPAAAAVADPAPVDAEFTDTGHQEAAGEAAAADAPDARTTTSPAADAPAQPADDGKASELTPAAVDAAITTTQTALKGLEAEVVTTAAQTGLALEAEAGGPDAATAAQDHMDGLHGSPAPAVDHSGLALDAYEDGHATGLRGGDMVVPRPWSEFADPWMEGWHGGAAERAQDAQEDDQEEDFAGEGDGQEPAEEEDPHAAAFEAFTGGLKALKSWGEIRLAINDLSKAEAWKAELMAPGARRIRVARVGAWCRALELREEVDVLGDFTAFRCWLEWCEDPEDIGARWQALVQTPLFQGLEASARSKLEAVVRERMSRLAAA